MTDITIREVRARMRYDDQLIDVREPFEAAEGVIPGARNIPLGDLPHRLGELDRSRPVIAVCQSGNRSGQAMGVLHAAGFRADSMIGGMRDWYTAGLPVRSGLAALG